MGNRIQRVGDLNDAGAAIVSTLQTKVTADGILVAVDGSPIEDHGDGAHNAAITSNGSEKVTAQGMPINRTNDDDSCEHTRVDNSSKVMIE